MKQFTLITILLIAVSLSGCGTSTSDQKKTTPGSSSPSLPAFELKVSKWGPDSTKIGMNPNKQPDGSMGIWIEVSSTEGLGESQVLFAGHPAKSTVVANQKLITAAISSEDLAEAGDKEIAIKQISTGKIFPVGTFKVTAK